MALAAAAAGQEWVAAFPWLNTRTHRITDTPRLSR